MAYFKENNMYSVKPKCAHLFSCLFMGFRPNYQNCKLVIFFLHKTSSNEVK